VLFLSCWWGGVLLLDYYRTSSLHTPFIRPVLNDPVALQAIVNHTPMGRVGRQAAVTAFLCMDASQDNQSLWMEAVSGAASFERY